LINRTNNSTRPKGKYMNTLRTARAMEMGATTTGEAVEAVVAEVEGEAEATTTEITQAMVVAARALTFHQKCGTS
jgi:hypothetical protein